MKMKYANQPLCLKDSQLQSDGTFTGYGSVFGELDSYRETVTKGAFAKSLKAWGSRGKFPSMLWQHDARQPIGIWTDAKEDDRGLKLTGQLATATGKGAEAYALLKMGALDGLSIGYVATKWEEDKKANTTALTEIDLWEVSLVTFPAGPSARVDSVKDALERGKLCSMKEFEAILRDVGLSVKDAKTVASHGYSHLLRQRDVDDRNREVSLADVLAVINTH